MLRRMFLLLPLSLLVMLGVKAQYKIVVIGSSTAEGAGSWPMEDSSWVSRLRKSLNINQTDNADTLVYNLAKGGYNSYKARETGCSNCPASIQPDPTRNVTMALSFTPDLMLVNFPTNDVANYITTKETMDNYRKYLELCNPTIKNIIYLTPQPRSDLQPDQKTQIRAQVDSVLLNFPGKSVNVWSLLVDRDEPGYYNIAPWVSAGDNVHVNNDGHRLIFKAVTALLAASALPTKLSKFNALPKSNSIELSWETATEINNSHFEVERSTNGREFATIGRVKGKGNSQNTVRYKFTDASPDPGKNFYRLKQVDLDKQFNYSGVISAKIATVAQTEILYPVPTTQTLHVKLYADKKEDVLLNIIDRSGHSWASYKRIANSGNNVFTIPVASLSSGNYVMQIRRESQITKRSFIKL
jgi:lysophospholipase L1-like esterase